MVLCLEYRTPSSIPVEVEGFTPDLLREKTVAEIERMEVFHGNRKEPLAAFFHVSGDPADEVHRWQGDLSSVHWLGTKMRSGEIQVEGRIGRHLGSEMRGGRITVSGDAGDWVGGEMHGGEIHVRGRAGHLIGAAYRGSPRGMTGGTIVIDGDVGNEVGHTMRRGLLVVGGNAGDLIGFNMLAGTILVFGNSGIRHGAGMRRGTLGFFGEQLPPLLPSFRHACRYRPEFLRILFRWLQQRGYTAGATRLDDRVDLYHGDMIEGGRGEILLRAT